MRIARLNGIEYEPLAPTADTPELAERGPRLMLWHGTPTAPESRVFVAPQGELNAGWVLGIVV